ncbi:MAG TPA: cell division control protein Cdc6, partial [Candidatus Aenigmarchaeota archaeon]|nr:cell division control protein Cdc6 [Candidatus Aenigmarchaeota archaeon]
HKVADTEYRLLSQVLYNFNINVPYTGLPTDELYRTFFNVIQSNPLNILLILDEIDYLVNKIGDNILYNLTRINEKLSKSKLTIIGISNNSTFINNLDPRVKSSLSEEEIIFPSYNANELKDILIDRIEIAFHPDTVTPQAIAKCAALAAQEHGDARKALDLIRVAGEIAERSGDNKVTEKHVDMAEKKLDIDKTFEILKTQPRQSQIVYFAIIKLIERGAKNILTGDVYDEYIKACERNGIRALTQRRVSDLISELEMIGMINCKVISLGRYGRTREIRINMPKTVFEKIKRFLEKEFI